MTLTRRQIAERRRRKLDARDANIRAEFKEKRKQGFTSERVIEDLAEQNHLEPGTVEKIVWGQTKRSTSVNQE